MMIFFQIMGKYLVNDVMLLRLTTVLKASLNGAAKNDSFVKIPAC